MAKEMTIAEAEKAQVSELARESSMAARPWVLPLCMLALGYAPLLVLRARTLFERPRPAALPIAVLAGLVLAWRASRRLGRLEPDAQLWSFAAVGLGMVALVVAGFSAWPWLGAVAAMTTLLAAAYGTGRARLLSAVLPAVALVALAVLTPVEMELWLIGALQTQVTAYAGPVLDVLGVIHLTEGNVIKITSGPLMVDEACSGVSSLFAAIGATFFYVAWTGRKLISAVLLMAAAASWVVLVNVVRIVAVVFAEARWGVDMASGWRHDVSDLIIFVAVMGLTLSSGQILQFLAALTRIRLFVPTSCDKGSDLRLMYSVQNTSDIPKGGRRKVIVAVVDHVLHFRIIGSDECMVVDTDEKALPEQARKIACLRKQLKNLWPPHNLTDGEKVRIIAIVTSIVDHSRERSRPTSRLNARSRAPIRQKAVESSTPTEFADVGRTWLASRRLGSVFAVVGLLQVAWLWPALSKAVRGDAGAVSFKSSVAALKSLNEGDLPDRLGPYLRAGFETNFHGTKSSFGEFSREWHYRSGRVSANAAVDFPFRGWHELLWCYTHLGWSLKERVVRKGEGQETGRPDAFVEAVLERPPLRHAMLFYGIDDMRGDNLKPPENTDPFEFNEKLDLFRFARGRLGSSADLVDQSLTDGYQVQLLIQTAAPISADQRTEARAIFVRLRRDVRHRVAAGTGAEGWSP